MNNTCCIYVRVSTIDKQETTRQINDLEDFADKLGFDVLKIFEDKITGKIDALARDNFSKMDSYIKANDVKNLLVWDLSRLGRKMTDIINTVEDYCDKGICIHFYNNKELKTLDRSGKKQMTTIITISILSGFAQMEREMIQERVVSGLRSSVSLGGSGGGIQPYGFENINKKLVVNQAEASVIKEIYDLYLNGMGTKRIASYLNNKGVPTRFNSQYDKVVKTKAGRKKHGSDFKWRDGTVYGILKNPIYKGERHYKEDVYEVEPIVKSRIFDKVQSTLSSNFNRSDINRKYENILKEKLSCGKCSLSYFMHKRKSNKDNAYKCLSKRYGENCGNPSISIDKLNNALYQILSDQIIMDKFTGAFNQDSEVEKLKREVEVRTAELQELLIELDNCETQRKNLIFLESSQPSFNVEDLNFAYNKAIDQEKSLRNKYDILSNELDRANESLEIASEFRNVTIENATIFKKHVSNYVDNITIYDLGNSHDLTSHYPNKQDKQLLFKVHFRLGGFGYFILSQRSDFMFLLHCEGDRDLDFFLVNLDFIPREQLTLVNEVKI